MSSHVSGLTVWALVARGLDIEKMGIFDVLVCDGPGGGVCFSVNVSRARQGLSRRGYSYRFIRLITQPRWPPLLGLNG